MSTLSKTRKATKLTLTADKTVVPAVPSPTVTFTATLKIPRGLFEFFGFWHWPLLSNIERFWAPLQGENISVALSHMPGEWFPEGTTDANGQLVWKDTLQFSVGYVLHVKVKNTGPNNIEQVESNTVDISFS